MRVKEIMQREVVTVDREQSCAQAAKVLRDHGISSLIVNGPDAPAGIITERDYVNLVADAAHIMAERHIRHLPVVDQARLVGVISIRDPVVRHPALHRYEEQRRRSLQAQVADRITYFAGSMPFVYVHAVWFALWIGLGLEPFPFGLLTMIVSLEAIFLSTFVMISQNRADDKRKVLADHQWELVQHEEKQNEELLQLSQNILNLTSEVHQLTVATAVRE